MICPGAQKRTFVKYGVAFAIGLLLLQPIAMNAQTNPKKADPLEGLDEYIRQGMLECKLPGFSIAIVKDDSVVLAKGYGVREYGKTAPVDDHTIFAIGSTTKAITATALGILVDEGKLNWDDPVVNHLPAFQLYDPWTTRHTTIRDLLTHRADTNPDLLPAVTTLDRDEVMHRLRYMKPDGPFRARFSYNNVMITVAGQVLAAAAGMSWDDFVRTRVFQPLGMKESYTTLDALWNREDIAPCFLCDLENRKVDIEQARNGANVALGHMVTQDGVNVLAPRRYDNIGPAGGELSSSARDMAQWLKLQVQSGIYNGKRIISARALEETHSPQVLLNQETEYFPRADMKPVAYGMGWFLDDYRGTRIVWHSGGVLGYRALIGLIPEKHVGVVILSNAFMSPLPPALMMRIFDAYLGVPERGWSKEEMAPTREMEQKARAAESSLEGLQIRGTHPALPLERYAGNYESPVYGTVNVKLENGALVLRFPGAQVADLKHWHYDVFRMKLRGPLDAGLFVTFSIDLKGDVAEMALDSTPTIAVTSPSARVERFSKVPEQAKSGTPQ